MDRLDAPHTPTRSSDYTLPPYEDEDTPAHGSGVRLLTEDPHGGRQYAPLDGRQYQPLPPPDGRRYEPLDSRQYEPFDGQQYEPFDNRQYVSPASPASTPLAPYTSPPMPSSPPWHPSSRDVTSALLPQPLQPKKPLTPEHMGTLREVEKAQGSICSSACQSPAPAPAATPTDVTGKPLCASPTVKLLRKKTKPEHVLQAEIAQSLPALPDGPSPRRRNIQKSDSCPGSPKHRDKLSVKFASDCRGSPERVSSNRPPHRTYQPSVVSSHSSIMDGPAMPPPDSTYVPFQRRDSFGSSRAWSPSRLSNSGYARPPPSSQYEPSDINGSPRPGTPSSRYGGSPRRPLPPQPLFSGPSRHSEGFADDATVSIPLDGDDDVFGSDYGHDNPRNLDRDSYGMRSEMTLEGDDHTEDDMLHEKVEHYGPAPEGKQERRGAQAAEAHMSKKEVQLINGELVLECKIPTILYSFLPRRDEIEFTHMRYTAVTCDPDDFVERGYKLRQTIGRTLRETELFICVTMYNEDEVGFTRTMHAVMKNISHFCSRSKSRTWGDTGWQKIVVAIVSDGREKIHPRTLDALAAMGVYQHGIAKNYVNQKAVQAHVYEYTTQVSLDSDLKFKGAEKGIVPCQLIFCLKEKNQRKLNSHRWFFNAFGKALNPNVCILLDVGTRPGTNSLYHLWKAFDTDSNVAGACGEIKAMKGRFGGNLLNPLVASQNFEYKMSNILDKPLESVFGYITVLPGALSAYRYHALQNDETGHGPLSQYFKGETLHGQHADVFTANMYLAEDRILCWELVAKRQDRWVLRYVKGCKGETDVPDTVPEFISQRRRWLNGAFFAAVYSLVHFRQVWNTDHTVGRKILLHIEFVYQLLQLLFTYFSLANFYLAFFFIAGGVADPKVDPFGHGIAKYIFHILRYTCVLLIATQFILSLGNRPQGAKKLYLASMCIYCAIMIYTTFGTIYIIIRQVTDSEVDLDLGSNVFTNLIVSISSTIGLYFLMSFLYLDPWHMFTSSLQYFLLMPSYICMLQVYAFCNTHDVTWGTKGDNVMKTDLGGAVGRGSTVELEMPSEQLDIDSGYDEALRNLRDRLEVPTKPISEEQLHEDYYKSVRTYMVVSWMIANAILAMVVSEAYGAESIGDNFYLRFILWSVASLALFRALGSTTFAILNAVNMVVEGRVRMRLKVPEWAGGLGGKMSETMSSIGTSMRR